MPTKRILLFIAFLAATAAASAQWDDEYKMEIGGGIGTVSYLGDFNGSITGNMQPMASLIAKRVFSPYMALAANISYGKLKGSSKDVRGHTFYPDYQNMAYSFDNAVMDIGVRFEYNFWPYGTGQDYRGARRLTPFVFGGLGMSLANTDDGSQFAANIPLGIGVKYKAANRVNVSLDWAMHFGTSDKLDGVADPYYIKSTGAFKNRDSYSTLRLAVTYSFMAKCKTCNNDRDD